MNRRSRRRPTRCCPLRPLQPPHPPRSALSPRASSRASCLVGRTRPTARRLCAAWVAQQTTPLEPPWRPAGRHRCRTGTRRRPNRRQEAAPDTAPNQALAPDGTRWTRLTSLGCQSESFAAVTCARSRLRRRLLGRSSSTEASSGTGGRPNLLTHWLSCPGRCGTPQSPEEASLAWV